jgi:uncharacterized protein involved in exopolysaccharide biosynthesis
MKNMQKEETLKDILKVVSFKYKLFLLGFAAFALGTMVVSHYIPLKYTSVARFERRSDSATDNISKNNRNESFETMKLTLEEDLCGNRAVEAVVEKLHLDADLPRDEKNELTVDAQIAKNKIIKNICDGLRVEWIRSQAVDQISLYCSCVDPDKAAAIANALVEQYQNNVSEQIVTRLRQSRDFLKTQVQQAQKQVVALTQAKTDFESKHSGFISGDNDTLQKNVQEAQADIDNLGRQRILEQQKVSQLKDLFKASKDLELKKQLKTIQDQIDQCMVINQMTESHPEVRKLKIRLNQLRARIRENQENNISDSSLEQSSLESNLALQIVSAQAQVEQVDSEIDRLQKRLDGYQSLLVKSVPLREEYLGYTKPLEEQTSQLGRWKALLTETEMNLTAEDSKRRTQFETIDVAKKGMLPQFPSLWIILGIALGGGLAFGYALAFIGDSMDHTLRSPEEAARKFQDFNVPVVGVVSKIMTSKEKLSKNIRTGVLTLVIVLAAIVSLGISTYSAVNRLQNGNTTQVREKAQQRIVHNNESDLANRPIRIQ